MVRQRCIFKLHKWSVPPHQLHFLIICPPIATWKVMSLFMWWMHSRCSFFLLNLFILSWNIYHHYYHHCLYHRRHHHPFHLRFISVMIIIKTLINQWWVGMLRCLVAKGADIDLNDKRRTKWNDGCASDQLYCDTTSTVHIHHLLFTFIIYCSHSSSTNHIHHLLFTFIIYCSH